MRVVGWKTRVVGASLGSRKSFGSYHFARGPGEEGVRHESHSGTKGGEPERL